MARLISHLVFFLSTSILIIHLSRAEVGTAARYSPPYLPSACYGKDASKFPSNNMFAAAGDGLWDNGASCGRKYWVRCISAPVAGTCIQGKTIEVIIVDNALTSVSPPSSNGVTLVLSTSAFGSIADVSAKSVNVEFQQV